ncbi:MAG: HAD hydrolase-like protein [Candidatus Desulforudis sp.]|nr:HAD hydrolase-like protein [Desulforudis sp.]
MLQGIYIIDADNTLWDTNAVFFGAQTKMIRTLQENGFRLDAETALQAMRTLDLEISVNLDNFEYDFSRLACALLLLDQGLREDETVRLVCAPDPPAAVRETARHAATRFYAHIDANHPRLFPGVFETLAALRAQGNTLVLHSEGLHNRILQTLDFYELKPLFDNLVLERKSTESFLRARSGGESLFKATTGRNPGHCIVVGDSPKRDIRFGNLIGATTVFKPGGWLGAEYPDDPLLIPHFTIDCFPELLELGQPPAESLGNRTVGEAF